MDFMGRGLWSLLPLRPTLLSKKKKRLLHAYRVRLSTRVANVCLKLLLTPTLPIPHPTITLSHRWLWRRSPLVVLWIKREKGGPHDTS